MKLVLESWVTAGWDLHFKENGEHFEWIESHKNNYGELLCSLKTEEPSLPI